VIITFPWNYKRAYWCKDKGVSGRLWKGLFKGGRRKLSRRREKRGKKNK